MRRVLKTLALSAALLTAAPEVDAHPHVFVDGGVDFVFGDGRVLEALNVTWLYDPFETLLILASLKIKPAADLSLSEDDRARLIAHESEWAADFDGTSHLSIDGERISLARPKSFDVKLRDNQLQVTFTRDLLEPENLAGRKAEVAVYEKTYFYALAVTDKPKIRGDAIDCAAEAIAFDPDTQVGALQVSLFALSREETPEIEDVGALFADRVVLKCD